MKDVVFPTRLYMAMAQAGYLPFIMPIFIKLK